MAKVRDLNPKQQKSINRDQLVTIGDLVEFESNIINKIRGLLLEFKGHPTRKWLKTYEVRKLLRISAGTIQTLRNNGTLPFTRIGGTIYYNSEDIENLLLEMQKRNPQSSFSNPI